MPIRQALQGVHGMAKVLLMEQRDNFKARKGTVYLAMGFDKRKSTMRETGNGLKELLCDDGADGDYAPDLLNPYSPSLTVVECTDAYFFANVFALHEETVKQSVIECARSGLTLDQAAVDGVHLVLPFLTKYPAGLQSRALDMALRLTRAHAALVDVFCSPEFREYRRTSHHHTPADPAAAALLKKSSVDIKYTKEEGGAELSFTCDIQHQYTFPPEFPRRIAFMTENLGRQGFFTGSFHSEAGTPTDAWLDDRFFTFAGDTCNRAAEAAAASASSEMDSLRAKVTKAEEAARLADERAAAAEAAAAAAAPTAPNSPAAAHAHAQAFAHAHAQAMAAAGIVTTPGGSAHGNNNGALFATGSTCSDEVFAICNAPLGHASEQGVHVNEVIAQLNGRFAEPWVRAAVNHLNNQGLIYSTIDDDHFVATSLVEAAAAAVAAAPWVTGEGVNLVD
jgi:hypothetical protein